MSPAASTTRCSLPSRPGASNEEEQPVRPPNFFGNYDEKELESLLEHHRTHFGERSADDASSRSDTGPVQGMGGLHDLVMDALREPANETKEKDQD